MTILADIVRRKAEDLAIAKRDLPESDLWSRARDVSRTRGFRRALAREGGEPVRVIAEYKRASPSAGTIRDDLEVEEVARQYAAAGASALSILTDEPFFRGHLSYLERARAACQLPLLRKDFIIDPYQVVETRAAGGDALLLIVAALGDVQLSELLAAAAEVQVDVLVEVHDAGEAERAVAAGATLIGVNHRDLKTFTIDMSLTGRLAEVLPAGAVLVGESGIRGARDVRALGESGAHAVLVGEHLMRAERPGDALAELLAGARA